MTIPTEQIIGLPTETQSGQYLGRVKSVELEPDTDRILYFYISPTLIKKLLCRQFIIHRDQVVRLTSEKLVVEDAAVKGLVSVWKKTKLELSATK